jgi:Ferritin-like domain
VTDSAPADHASDGRATRRALLGAGVVGAAIALTGARPASAASSGLSDEDLALSGFAIALELTARDLYDAAIEAGADDDVWMVMREQHEAYAQRLAGITGIPAAGRNDVAYDQLIDAMATRDPAATALQLENIAAATHTELLGSVDDVDLATAMASFASMENRHATVLALLSGQSDDLDVLLSNSATALSPEV